MGKSEQHKKVDQKVDQQVTVTSDYHFPGLAIRGKQKLETLPFC